MVAVLLFIFAAIVGKRIRLIYALKMRPNLGTPKYRIFNLSFALRSFRAMFSEQLKLLLRQRFTLYKELGQLMVPKHNFFTNNQTQTDRFVSFPKFHITYSIRKVRDVDNTCFWRIQ